MITTQFEMRATQSEHHRIRQQDARCIELSPMIRLIIVHIGSENRIQLIIAIHSVFIQDGFQMGKVRLIRPYV